MSTPLIIQVPADTTPVQWDQIHRALAEHRLANGTADVVSAFPPPPPPPPASPVVEQPSVAAAAPSLLDILTSPQAAPAAPVPVPAVIVEPTGDPSWLSEYVGANNAFPTVGDDNWFHVLADETVKAACQGTAHEETLKTLRKQAGAAKARWVKSHKVGNGGAQQAQPATARMGALSDLIAAGTIAPVVAQPQPTPEPKIVNLPSDLTADQLKAVRAYRANLVDTRKVALVEGWLQGDTNPVTNRPLTLDDLDSTGLDVATKIRRKVRA